MSSSGGLIAQLNIAKAARERGEISQQDYVRFVSNQNRLIAEARAREAQQRVTAQTTESNVSPFPPQPGTVDYSVRGSYVQAGSTIVDSKGETVGVVGSKDMAPLKEGETYSVVIPNRFVGPVADPVESARQLHDVQEQYSQGAAYRQGTSMANTLDNALGQEAKITQNLTPEQKQQYVTSIQVRNTERLTNLGTMLGASVVAPVLGPASAAKAAVGSIALTQAVNTGVTAYQGRDISKSILTPMEIAQAGATGIIFSGAIGAGARAASVAAPRINTAAESVLARSSHVFEKSLNRFEPGLGKAVTITTERRAANFGKLLDVHEAKLTQKLTPIKNVKAEAVAIGQRATDKLTPQFVKNTDAFIGSVVKPNLKNYGAVLKTSTPYRQSEMALTGARNEFKAISKPFGEAFKPVGATVSKAKLSRAYGELLFEKAYRGPVDTRPLWAQPAKAIPKRTVKTYTLSDVLAGDSEFAPVKASRNIRASIADNPTIKGISKADPLGIKTTKPAQTAKFIGKVAAGKTRQTLDLRTPKYKLPKSSRTPMKFTESKPNTKPFNNISNGESKAMATLESAESKLTSGGISKGITPYPGLRVKVKEEEETQFLTFPRKPLTIAKPMLAIVNPTVIATAQPLAVRTQVRTRTIANTTPILSKATRRIINERAKPASIMDVATGIEQPTRIAPSVTPSITPIIEPKITPRQTVISVPKLATEGVVKPTVNPFMQLAAALVSAAL